MYFLVEIFSQAFWFLKESAPYMLIGIVVAGMLRHMISEERFTRYFGQNRFKSVGLASLFGIPLPLCSCSVLPMMVSLRKQGASKGAATSFLISTPETGVDSISITYALLDPIFTVARPVAALITALFTGSVVNFFERRNSHANGMNPADAQNSNGPAAGNGAACNDTPNSAPSCCAQEPIEQGSFMSRSMRYGFGPLMDDLTPLLILAFLGSGFIAAAVPDKFFENPVTQGWPGMFLMLIVGVPIYVCATSSTPLVAALLLKGLSPGAALVFLLAGPVTNLGTILATLRYLGKRVMVIYVVCTAGLTLLMGGIIESIYNDLGIPVTAIVGKTTGLLPLSVKITALIILMILMGASIVRTNLIHRWSEKARRLCAPLGFDPLGKRAIFAGTALLVALYATTCFSVVDVGEEGWLFTFGKVARDEAGRVIVYEPGLIVHLPYPFQSVRTEHPQQIRNLAFGFRPPAEGDADPLNVYNENEEALDLGLEAQVMDGQESLVSLRFSVHYRLVDTYAYTMGFDDPERLIGGYACAAVRTVCAKRSTQDILVGHRRELEAASKRRLQNELNDLGIGVEIVQVMFVDVHAPPEVHFSFRDVASAAEDKHEQELVGESFYRETLAAARADAHRIEQEAESYGDLIRSEAVGKSTAFTERSSAYQETRELTRLRMFLSRMGQVLSITPLVVPLQDGIEVELWMRGKDGREPPFTEGKSEGKTQENDKPKKTEPAPERDDNVPDWYKALRH